MRLLQAAGLDIAPQPLWLDESCTILPYPAVVYPLAAGDPLAPPLTQEQLAALIGSIQRLHASGLEMSSTLSYPGPWFHWFDFAPYLDELRRFLTEYGPWLVTADPEGHDLADRLARLVDGCAAFVATTTADPGREVVPLRLCPGTRTWRTRCGVVMAVSAG